MAHSPCLPRAVESKPCIISEAKSRHLQATVPLPLGGSTEDDPVILAASFQICEG